MPQLHVRVGNKRNMYTIILIFVGLFIIVVVDNSKENPRLKSKQCFTNQQIQYLQSQKLISDEDIEKYRNNKQIISSN